jgi:ubiquinone/menaquinone biosynthesis C-methylase UbiE
MTQSIRRADYDQIAPTFDRRYERKEYAGVERALREFIGNEPHLNIFEAGCGTGHWLDVLQASVDDVIGLDYSVGMLTQARRSLPRMALIRGTADHLPFPTVSLDRVFCINALHHFPNKPAFLAEVKRVLRPVGKMLSVGLDPHRDLDKWHVYDYFQESLPIDRQRYPSSEVLCEWMSEAGFQNCITYEVDHWVTRLPAREVLEQGRLDKAVTSQLSVLTDEEYERGIQRIWSDMEHAEAQGRTLFLTTDLRMYATTGSV